MGLGLGGGAFRFRFFRVVAFGVATICGGTRIRFGFTEPGVAYFVLYFRLLATLGVGGGLRGGLSDVAKDHTSKCWRDAGG